MAPSSQSNNKAKSNVHQPHDKLVKKLLAQPETAKDILSLYLPQDISPFIDLNHLSLQPDSFIDDEHRAFEVDLLYKTTFQGKEAYIWILLEHLRQSDPWLPVRIFKYIATIWEHIRRTSKRRGKHTIPLIYPLIIYNGDRPYSHSLTLRDMIEPNHAKVLFDSFFKTPFPLIDLSIITDETLKKHLQEHVRGIALLLTLKHVNSKNLQRFFENELLSIYQYLDQLKHRDELGDMLYYLLNESKFLDEQRFFSIVHDEFSPEIGANMTTIAQKLQEKGIAIGEQRGITIGEQRGIAIGEQKGIAYGIEYGIEQVATNLLAEGHALELIARVTKLPLSKIKQLKKQLH